MTINPKHLIPRRDFLTTVSFGILAGFGLRGDVPGAEKQTAKAFDALSSLVWWDLADFKVDRHLRAAIELQALGKDLACDVLYSFAKKLSADERHYSYQENSLIALVRMFFVKRPGSEFRSAYIGAPGFFGDSDDKDWQIDPIEIVDGVPFSIVQGYMLFGQAEPAYDYIGYCIENCDWNSYKFEVKSEEQKQKALKQLLASPKFKTPLSEWERKLLSDQIQ